MTGGSSVTRNQSASNEITEALSELSLSFPFQPKIEKASAVTFVESSEAGTQRISSVGEIRRRCKSASNSNGFDDFGGSETLTHESPIFFSTLPLAIPETTNDSSPADVPYDAAWTRSLYTSRIGFGPIDPSRFR